MSCSIRVWSLVVVASLLTVADAHGRDWTDVWGEFGMEADLFGFDDENVVLQRPDKELGMLRTDALSKTDREYLESKEAIEINNRNINGMQTWTSKSGVQLVGRLVDYAQGKVVIQRRRGRIYVNDRAFDNLPELYRKLVPKLVEHFEGVSIPDQRALENWVQRQWGRPKTFQVEGVILELENGDEYAIPFFVFTDRDQRILKRGWPAWVADQNDYDKRDDHAFRLQSSAAAYQQNQEMNRQIAQMNLGLQAINAGITSAWEVTLYPVPGNPSPPRWVVVAGRNSAQATAMALQQNPGFTAGPVRRVSH